jgi:hypothetical protein
MAGRDESFVRAAGKIGGITAGRSPATALREKQQLHPARRQSSATASRKGEQPIRLAAPGSLPGKRLDLDSTTRRVSRHALQNPFPRFYLVESHASRTGLRYSKNKGATKTNTASSNGPGMGSSAIPAIHRNGLGIRSS